MTAKKFFGKIRTDPWESLARGAREVMASIWGEYLTEALPASPKSGRFKALRREIEKVSGFQQVFEDWNRLTPEERAAAWRRLVTAAREVAAAHQETCVRCGECCERSSPTLLLTDLPLFAQEALTWNEVYTLRRGETVTDREGQVTTLAEERLKVREMPGSRQCWFYQAAGGACRIYETRPEQCRRQNCWGDPAPPPTAEELLSREHLFQSVPEVWELINAHRQRCDLIKVKSALQDLGEGREEGGDYLFEVLHFDHYLRQVLKKEWELTPAVIELLLGRPLTDFLREHGYQATLGPEGVFHLTPRQGGTP